jgi:hypothetical protein
MRFNAPHWNSGYMPLIIGGIGAMGSALLMPWVVVASSITGAISRTGIQLHDGRFFALGLAALALVAWSEARAPKALTRTVLLVGLIVLGLAGAVEYRDLTRMVAGINDDGAVAKLGFGIFAMGLGLTFSVAGVLKRRIALQPAAEPAVDSDQFAA